MRKFSIHLTSGDVATLLVPGGVTTEDADAMRTLFEYVFLKQSVAEAIEARQKASALLAMRSAVSGEKP